MADNFELLNDQFTCCVDYDADIYIQGTDRVRLKLGDVVGVTLDKTVRSGRRPRGPPDWARTVLSIPGDYDGEIGLHSRHKDKLADTHRLFQLLFDRVSQRPKRDFGVDIGHLLDSDTLHFIDYFCLEPDFRGKGFAKDAMLTYLDAVDQMPGECRYQGPVLLSPGPLTDETERMKEAG
ncbi:hypothetical protein PRZ48_008976 [Zasmidium cellare]|uniref:N-acetyltransferase domain-containing protein n=1 Tax=Zasmidium cellare TaxID=395010 RepID=A0ABR0EHN8_ZASCE|nr:hypothetical protein PRZ48_008976 [Zasmidium cellare]